MSDLVSVDDHSRCYSEDPFWGMIRAGREVTGRLVRAPSTVSCVPLDKNGSLIQAVSLSLEREEIANK